MSPSIYTTGGTVQAGGGIYLSRRADDELLQLCREGQFAYVLTSRQMGKSSLMVQTAERLEEEGITSIIIDLTKIGTNVTAEQWYLGLLTEIDESVDLDTDIFDWWEDHSHLGLTQRLTRFFEAVLLAEVAGRIVIFVDEIDTTLSLDFTDDFFIAMRYFYVARAQKENMGRLSVVLIGVATPGDLIRDPQRTPFNVGQRVDLTDFTWDEAQGFAAGLAAEPSEAQQVLHWVMQWTGGHPYLTQRLCQGIAEEGREQWSAAAVGQLVEKLFLSAGVRNDNNLLFVRDMLTQRTPDGNSMVYDVLSTYKEVWREKWPELDEEQSLVKSHLKLSGVVRREEKTGALYVSNKIYRGVFDEGWVKEHLPENWVKRLQRERTRAIIAALFAITAVSVPLSVLAEFRRSEANRLQAEAVRNEWLARESASEAARQAQIAADKAEEALQNATEADEQRNLAEKQTKLAEDNATEAGKQTELAQQQAELAQRQTVVANEATQQAQRARALEAEQRQEAEAARIEEAEQRSRAEAQTIEVNAQKAIAEQQTEIAQWQTILAQGNASKALLLSNRPLDALIAAVSAWQIVKTNNIQSIQASLPAQAALVQGVYNNYTFNLNRGFYEKNQLKSHGDSVLNVSFSPDGNTIASASSDGTVKLWDRNGTLLNTLEGDGTFVRSLTFSPDGNIIASASRNGRVTLWKRNGTPLTTFKVNSIIWSIAFSPDGSTIASANADRTVKLWDREGNLLNTLESHDGWVFGVAFSPDGETIASASADRTVKLWNREGNLLGTLESHDDRVLVVTFSPNGQTIASASEDGTVKLWDRSRTLLHTLKGHFDEVSSVAFSPDGKTLASASYDRTVKLWDSTGTLLSTLEGHSAVVYDVAFSPDGNTLASASDDRTVKLWDSTGTLLSTPEGHNTVVYDVAFSPDGDTIASAGGDGTISLWNRTGTLFKTLEGHSANVSSVAFSPGGDTIASAGGDGTISLWNRTGTLFKTLEGHSVVVYDVAFSPGGDTIASASGDSTVKLWDRNGNLINILEGHSDRVLAVAFSPDGNTIASASEDLTVKLWDKNGNLLNTLEGHNGWVRSVAFSHDGNTIASASDDRTVKLWDRNPETLIAWSCNWLQDYLLNNPDGRAAANEGVCREYLPRRSGVVEWVVGWFR